ncbi:MAG: hypothetical protein IJU71_01970, partial [Selenomonadaceae bacterium]|nr:hypothetical protein [Selenomonadaceae bacterium]
MWGGNGGDDTLIGGGGDDTFQAGMGEGNTHISLAASNDLVYLWNVNGTAVKSIANAIDEEGDRVVRIITSDDTGIFVTSSIDETSTTILLA